MEDRAKELRKIRGIGGVLAVRLVDAGLDTHEKVAAAGDDDLRRIRGMNPHAVASIREQAARLGQSAGESREERIVRLKAEAGELKVKVAALAVDLRERFGEGLEGKKGRKLEKEIFRLMDRLGRMEDGGELKPNRTRRALEKSRRRLEGVEGCGVKRTRKGLKRARRALQ